MSTQYNEQENASVYRNVRRSIFFTIRVMLLLASIFCAGNADAQKPDKNLDFCYWKYPDTVAARNGFKKAYPFYRLHNNDTLVDVGAASGGLEGALASFMTEKNVHFVLVDIDSNCLNETKLRNVQTYYSQVKGAPLNATFSMVHNTPDSLFLPLHSYGKVLIFNTLHEIPDQAKMARQISDIMYTGGELIVGEALSRPGHRIHGGCRQALLDEKEIQALFESNGFRLQETLMNPGELKKTVNPLMLARFVKL